ncbi:MAG: hypothetical protein ABI818_15130 [Acidobacteriota bacterium]
MTAGRWLLAGGMTAIASGAIPLQAQQSLNAEVDVSAGASTENVRAGSMQARVFGASASDWRFVAEVSMAGVDGQLSDAFNGAYPYDGQLRLIEAYGEKMFRPRQYLLGIRAGRYRTPFGISNRSDHAYTGFVRPPLIRYGKSFALSNTFLEGGADLIAGTPQLFVETSLGVPQDEGTLRRRQGLDATIRVQGYYRSLIVGASRMHSGRDRSLASFAKGRSVFNGIDARWMARGVQLRGEWLVGRPFDGVTTTGGYADLLVHHRQLGPVTLVARAERLDYVAVLSQFSLYLHRFTGGARIRLLQNLSTQINVSHQPTGLAAGRRTVLDAGITYSLRR